MLAKGTPALHAGHVSVSSKAVDKASGGRIGSSPVKSVPREGRSEAEARRIRPEIASSCAVAAFKSVLGYKN